MSIPEETINTSSNWTHLKVFCENVKGEIVLHQILMPSVSELKIFIQKLPEILIEAVQFDPTEVSVKLVTDEICSNQLIWRRKQNSMCSENWVRLPDEKCVWPEHLSKMIQIGFISQSSSSHEGLKNTVLRGNVFFRSEMGSCWNYIEWTMKLFLCWTKSKTKKRAVRFGDSKLVEILNWSKIFNYMLNWELARWRKLSEPCSEVYKKEETVFPVIKKVKKVSSKKIDRQPKELKTDPEFH